MEFPDPISPAGIRFVIQNLPAPGDVLFRVIQNGIARDLVYVRKWVNSLLIASKQARNPFLFGGVFLIYLALVTPHKEGTSAPSSVTTIV